MNYSTVNTPYSRGELAAVEALELSEAQKDQIIVVCGRMGISPGVIASLLESHLEGAKEAAQVIERPDLGTICVRSGNLPPSRDEQRRRSMSKPTGKPWDR